MGKKNRQQQQAPTVTVGRHQRTPPPPTTAGRLAAQVDRRAKESAAVRELQRKLAAEEAAHEATKYRHHIDDVILLNKQAMGLDDAAFKSLDRTVEHALEKHLGSGSPLKAFPAYDVVSAWKARHGRALPPAPKDANALTMNLPPPSQEGHTMPNDAAAREAQHREAQERGARLRKQVLEDRRAYQEALRRYGLLDPAIGSTPGDARGGLGS
jgi:hypothetical protein